MKNEKPKELLCHVVERYLFHQAQIKSNNPEIREFAKQLCEIELWEMWVLTQK